MQKSLQGTEDPATQEGDKPWEGGTQGGVFGGGLAIGLPKARRASRAYSVLSCWCPIKPLTPECLGCVSWGDSSMEETLFFPILTFPLLRQDIY